MYQIIQQCFTPHNVKILLFSVVINIVSFMLVETVRRLFSYPGNFSRKIIHMIVALWGVWAFFSFENRQGAVILPLLFIVAYIKPIRLAIFRLSDIRGNSHPGMIYYPIALVLLFWFCWDYPQRWAGMIGILTMGFGDPLAAIIGSRYGKQKYRFGELQKSYIGSATMFSVCFIITSLIINAMSGNFYAKELGVAITISLGATFLEAVCGRGLDNLSVPIGSALIYSFFYL